MHLNTISLASFRNYAKGQYDFKPGLNTITGPNGTGKTNLLAAIYYLCMGKSPYLASDQAVVKHGNKGFTLRGEFLRQDRIERIHVRVYLRKSKVISRNGVAYQRLAEHVGLLPVVYVSPDDTALIRAGSEERRRFLDNTLSQIDPDYLKNLIIYNRLIKQRNLVLRDAAEKGQLNEALLSVYDEQLLLPTHYIYDCRKNFVTLLGPEVIRIYRQLSNGREEVGLSYQSHLQHHPMKHLLMARRQRDMYLQRSSAGIHKDELNFTLNGKPLKRFASQGQTKSYVLALKLAQYELLKNEIDTLPILLLDDIFDKLDANRVTNLLQLLTKGQYGQLFLTDTDPDRLAIIVQSLGVTNQLIHLQLSSHTECE